MNQIEWQKKVIREEYIQGAEVDVRSAELYRIWTKKGLHALGKNPGPTVKKIT